MVDSEFGGEKPKSAESRGGKGEIPSLTYQTGKSVGDLIAVPVTVDFRSAGSESTPKIDMPQQNGTKSAADSHRLLRESAYTPISLDLSDPIKVAPQNLRRERTLKELAQKQIAPVTEGFEYTPKSNAAASLSRAEKLKLGKSFGGKPVSTGYHGDWYAVQPEETERGIRPRTYVSTPQTYEEALAEYIGAKNRIETINQAMRSYELESNDPKYMDTAGYTALSREYGRAWAYCNFLLQQYPSLQQTFELQEYTTEVNDDDFWGQSAANFDVGQLTELTNAAYNQYLDDPTEDNKAYAEYLEHLLKQYIENNAAVLDDQGQVLPWLSQSAAGYLPQFGHQLEAGGKGALAFGGATAAVGSFIPGIGTAAGFLWGAPKGYVAGVGIHSYEQMRGAAYRRLIDLGADEATARAAATDEAVVSALIEMVDAGIDLATLGTAKIASPVWKKVARMLLAYGINILGEGGEESLQEAVSISNDDRVARGEYDAFDNAWGNKLGLIFDSAGTTVDAVTGRDTGARDAMLRSGLEGMKVAALFGAPGMVVSNFSGYDASDSAGTTSGSTESDADIMTETEQNAQTTESTVQSPVERGIMLWKQQLYEAAEQADGETSQVTADDSGAHRVLPELNTYKAENSLEAGLSASEYEAFQNDYRMAALELALEEKIKTQNAEKTPEQLADEGTDRILAGEMPSEEQLAAMGKTKAEALGDLAVIAMSMEDDSSVSTAQPDYEYDILWGENRGSETTSEPQKSVAAEGKNDTADSGQSQESSVQADDGSDSADIDLWAQQLREAVEAETQEQDFTQSELAEIGEALLSAGIMPRGKYFAALGIDKPRARGTQAVMRMALEDSPARQQAAEIMAQIRAEVDARMEQRNMVGEEKVHAANTKSEEYGQFRCHDNGTVVVTDDWKPRGKVPIPSKYKPNAVMETATAYKNGKNQIDRSFFDEDGWLSFQIHSGDHNKPYAHRFGVDGNEPFHKHRFYRVENGVRRDPNAYNLTDAEKRMNSDIIKEMAK